MLALLTLVFMVAVSATGASEATNEAQMMCAVDEVFDAESNRCVSRTVTDKPTKRPRPTCKYVTLNKNQYEWVGSDQVYVANLNLTVSSQLINETKDQLSFCYKFSDAFMACRRWKLESDEIEVKMNGLKIWVPTYQHLYDTGDFYFHSDDEGNVGAVVCVRNAAETKKTVLHVYYASWIISEICLVIAFILCVTLPQFSFMYHVLPFYIGSLFFSYLMLILRSFTAQPTSATCYFYAVTLQFFFLSAFFWLNVLAFDIWRTLSKRQWYLEVFNRHCHRLVGFSVYAFGLPFVIVVFTIIVDVYNVGSKALQPHFLENCWFNQDLSKLAFFYGPVAVILAVNIVFFLMTIVGLRKNDKGLFRDSIEKKHLWRTALELAVLMGLCWIMEVVSWAVTADESVWYFTDIINGLQGFFILIVILTKPRVLSTIWEWLRSRAPCSRTKA